MSSTENTNKPTLTGQPFVVDETPYCVWGYDLAAQNLTYIEGIDPTYFEHIAQMHGPLIDGEEGKYASIAVRVAYSHALETLFALLCATLQSPHAVTGWMARYRNNELRSVVWKIDNRRKVLTAFDTPIYRSWETVSQIFFQYKQTTHKDVNLRELFADLWNRLASDFLDEQRETEYNSIKHGMRVVPGGFTLAFGAENTPGVPAPPENMRLLGGSKFGSAFYTTEQLQDKLNFSIRRNSLNWSPETLIIRLHLISSSISNIVTFLKILHGVSPSELNYVIPTDITLFERAWAVDHSITSFSTSRTIDASNLPTLSKEDILKVYERSDITPSTPQD